MSLQLQPEPLALSGERWPFEIFDFPFATGFDGTGTSVVLVVVPAVRLDIRRTLIGLLLLDLALLNSALTSSSSSISSLITACDAAACFFLADLVVGPKYPSCESRDSEGVGEGLITLGVAGIEFDAERDIAKGGNRGARITPVKNPTISGT